MVTVQTPLSVTSNNKLQLIVYPIPAIDALFISNPNHLLITSVAVYDILGQILINNTKPDLDGRLDVTSLATGSYFLQINTNLGVHVVRFIKE
jgi:hypothetical protein